MTPFTPCAFFEPLSCSAPRKSRHLSRRAICSLACAIWFCHEDKNPLTSDEDFLRAEIPYRYLRKRDDYSQLT
jgi:hypothetical protein